VTGVSLVSNISSVRVKTELLSEEPLTPRVEAEAAADGPQGVTPTIVAVIEAAVAGFLGRKARILSIKLIGNADGEGSAWASQGRDMIQTSHNLVQRGH
jgi:hypothetical protein